MIKNNLGRILRQRRIAILLTLHELAAASGVSAAHLGRIETGERFPSARILRKIAKPLGFDEGELFTLAGFLSPQTSSIAERNGHLYVIICIAIEPPITRTALLFTREAIPKESADHEVEIASPCLQ